MCPLPCETGSDSDSCIDVEDRSVDAPGTNYPPADVTELNLVRIANKKVKLLTVLQQYGLKVVRPSQWSIWSNAITCPFSFHSGGNERTPSFGYNFQDDFFYCLGCSAHGHAVEFISFRDGTDKLIVAEQIIRDNGGYDIEDIEENYDSESVNKIMFEFSKYVSCLVQKHKDNEQIIEQIDKVLWWVDQYLVAKVPKKQIIVESLQERLSRAKGLLEEFNHE